MGEPLVSSIVTLEREKLIKEMLQKQVTIKEYRETQKSA